MTITVRVESAMRQVLEPESPKDGEGLKKIPWGQANKPEQSIRTLGSKIIIISYRRQRLVVMDRENKKSPSCP